MSELTYFALTGNWIPDVPDGSLSGQVTVRMLIADGSVFAAPTLDVPGVVVPTVVAAQIINGVLCDAAGNPGVQLLSNTAVLNLSTALYYTATIEMTYHPPSGISSSVDVLPITFRAPADSTPINLTLVTPAPGVTAAQVVSVTSAQITDATAVGKELLTAASAAAVRTAVGAAAESELSSAISGLVPWAAATVGVLPANSGQHLTTQGGNTLDDGSGNVVIKGGALDGVTIGATTASPSIHANTLTNGAPLPLSGASNSWLNQDQLIYGTNSEISGYFNQLTIVDEVVNTTAASVMSILNVTDIVVAPAVGARTAIFGNVDVNSIGTVTNQSQAFYVGVTGRAVTSSNLGGTGVTATTGVGGMWGGWFFAGLNTGATNQGGILGVEINTYIESGASATSKIGMRVTNVAPDAVRGATEDVGYQLCAPFGSTPGWQMGFMFGSNQDPLNPNELWPFASDSTIIGTCLAGTGLPANIGIDWTQVTFTDAAIKTGPAAIAMQAMASAPTAASGEGRLYVASDGSLHYAGHTTDTLLAPA